MTTWISLADIMLNKIRQAQKKMLYDLTFVWDLKKVDFVETECRNVASRGYCLYLNVQY